LPPAQSPKTHVHILMATRNGMPWVEAQLASILAQAHRDWSLWISDDGSTDGTRAVLEAFRQAHPGRVGMIGDGPGRGAAANFLHLLRHPDLPSGVVAFCDQDDVWRPQKLSMALERLAASGAAPAVWSARYVFADERLSGRRTSADWPRPPAFGNAVVQNILSGHTLTMNAAALSLLRRGPDPDVPHHDWWVYLVMASGGARMIHDARIALTYRQHGQNVLGARHLGRLARMRALADGTMGGWIRRNLRALAAADVPLTAEAQGFLQAWQAEGRLTPSLLRDHGIYRQSWIETRLLQLVAARGKL
jgi:glycosyltransferase involved in cell wall biosynthesis